MNLPPSLRPATDAPGLSAGWAAVLVTVLTGVISVAVSYGVTAQRIDTKVDAVTYQKDQTALERRLGEMQGDVRVIRAAVCSRSPEYCQ